MTLGTVALTLFKQWLLKKLIDKFDLDQIAGMVQRCLEYETKRVKVVSSKDVEAAVRFGKLVKGAKGETLVKEWSFGEGNSGD
jgi:hypothetical protein